MSRLLLDECIPRPLADAFHSHYIRTVPQMGWASIVNGELIKLAADNFDVFITVDKGLIYQQDIKEKAIALILLRARSNRLEDLLPLMPAILIALSTITAGDIVH